MTRVRKSPDKSSASPAAVAPAPAEPSLNRYLAAAAALVAGAVLWALAGGDMPWPRWAVVLGAVGVSLIPAVNRSLAALLDRIRRPSRGALDWATLLIGVGATAYLVATAFWQHRGLFPRTHDECSYVIAARMLAHGRLWMPQHPLADFFESIYILVKPVYCSIYFPGAALFFAPMEWFDWPTWMIPVVIAGASVALTYRLVTELLDGAAGALAALWLVSLGWFRTLSMMSMAHGPALLLGLLILWAWLRWRDNARRAWGWALAVGAFSGWAAITRPADALAYAVPVGVAMMLALRRSSLRKWLLTGAMLLAGATPFLALQVAFNLGATGRPLKSAYVDYLERDQPGSQFGVRRYDPAWRPKSSLEQKHIHYDWCRPLLQLHEPHNFLTQWVRQQEFLPGMYRPANFTRIAHATLPARELLLLLPLGVLALRGRQWIVIGVLAVFVAAYALNPFFLQHYPVVVAPMIAILVLAGWRAASIALGRAAGVALATSIAAVSLTALPELNRFMPTPGKPADGMLEGTELSTIHEVLHVAVRPPAVVLFGPRPAEARFKEPVYNTDVAWPDDAPVIHARDLGPARNPEIVAYYAARQPDRTFYHYDWKAEQLTTLGQADELHARLRQGATWESIAQPAPPPSAATSRRQ
jgi:hypothetical protein